MHELVERVRKNIPEGTVRILVGVSGGADSVALLRALCMAGGPEVVAVHCNFGLRGEEALRDQHFAEALCESLSVPLKVVSFDAGAVARERGVSLEMACRDLRYDLFRRMAAELGCQRIAVGHHLDDNIETMLLNLFRGTGIRGLAGMAADNGEIIRPMLDLPRSMILDFLSELGQDFITDSSNLSDAFRRNYIRNTLLPALETRWPGVRKALARTQSNLRSEAALIDDITGSSLSDSGQSLDTSLLRDMNPEGATTLIHRFISPAGGNGIQAREIADALSAGRFPRRWPLPGGIMAVLDRHRLFITATVKADTRAETHPFSERIIPMSAEAMERIRADRSNSFLFSPVPLADLTFRHPLPADRIAPLGMKGSRLLSDLLKDLHIPATDRPSLWLAADAGGRIIWIEGVRRSRHLMLNPAAHKHIYIIGRH